MLRNLFESLFFRVSEIVWPFNRKLADFLREKAEARAWAWYFAMEKAKEAREDAEIEAAWAEWRAKRDQEIEAETAKAWRDEQVQKYWHYEDDQEEDEPTEVWFTEAPGGHKGYE